MQVYLNPVLIKHNMRASLLWLFGLAVLVYIIQMGTCGKSAMAVTEAAPTVTEEKDDDDTETRHVDPTPSPAKVLNQSYDPTRALRMREAGGHLQTHHHLKHLYK